jgi:hypothetical protein
LLLQITQTLAETRLCVIKDGPPANDIRVDGSWRKEIGTCQDGFKVKKFYFMSLHTTKFDIDFRRIGSENRDIVYQYDE